MPARIARVAFTVNDMRFAIGSVAFVVMLGTQAAIARADPPPPVSLRATQSVDMPITVGALGLAVLPIAIPERPHRPWEHELVDAIDLDSRDNFSPRAATISDVSLALTLAAPAVYLSSTSLTDDESTRLSLYTETLAVDLALVQLAKYAVQRPRPYTYGRSAAARAYAKAEGDDAYRSFYSSHAAMGFGAAVAGAYLFGAGHADPHARAAVWGLGLTSAAFTANLRVRAGKHFYSDVLVGAIVGSAIGYAVPALHVSPRSPGAPAYSPNGGDLALGAAGILVGTLASELIPLGRASEGAEPGRGYAVAPMPLEHGAGLAFAFSR
jgi:membrane-associated phospholipid phosphatase